MWKSHISELPPGPNQAPILGMCNFHVDMGFSIYPTTCIWMNECINYLEIWWNVSDVGITHFPTSLSAWLVSGSWDNWWVEACLPLPHRLGELISSPSIQARVLPEAGCRRACNGDHYKTFVIQKMLVSSEYPWHNCGAGQRFRWFNTIWGRLQPSLPDVYLTWISL